MQDFFFLLLFHYLNTPHSLEAQSWYFYQSFSIFTLFFKEQLKPFLFFKPLGLCFKNNLPRVLNVPRSHAFIALTSLSKFSYLSDDAATSQEI